MKQYLEQLVVCDSSKRCRLIVVTSRPPGLTLAIERVIHLNSLTLYCLHFTKKKKIHLSWISKSYLLVCTALSWKAVHVAEALDGSQKFD